MAHALLQHAYDPCQRQDHLDVRVRFGRDPAELLHGALLINLISFLHGDSPFSWKKNFPEAITPRGVRVATFSELPGNFHAAADIPSGADEYVQHLVEHYIDYDVRFRQRVKGSLHRLDRGEFLTHEEVGERLREMFQP
jgi:hypothetical protein